MWSTVYKHIPAGVGGGNKDPILLPLNTQNRKIDGKFENKNLNEHPPKGFVVYTYNLTNLMKYSQPAKMDSFVISLIYNEKSSKYPNIR